MYSSAALRASLADGKIDKSNKNRVFSEMNNHKTARCRKQLGLQEKLGKALMPDSVSFVLTPRIIMHMNA